MSHSNLEEQLLNYVNQPGYRPLKPRAIARQMGLSEQKTEDLKKVVKRLIKSGRLAYGASHLLLPVQAAAVRHAAGAASSAADESDSASDGHSDGDTDSGSEGGSPAEIAATRIASAVHRHGPNHMTGVFRRAQAGFGFVRPADSLSGADRKLDVFIPADKARDAASGDTVLVRLQKTRDVRRPNPVGEVVEVLERDTHQFVGTYFESAGNAYAQVDGTVFSRPVLLGDPGAKNAQPDDKIVFEMIRFPSNVHDGEGVISEVLGPRGAPGVDTLSIIREFGLPEHFAEDALEEARHQADRFDETIPKGRLDLTGTTTITIDPIDARDFDDAVSLEQLENGHWRLGVHIADVSHFVRPKTPLDREARERGTSVYLPDRVIPMLPEILSNGLASLQPDKVRYTKTVFIEFTADGAPVGADSHSAAIRSRRRFTYEEVDEYLADRDAWRSRLAPQVHALLGRMHELAMILRKRRFKRGALELTMKEIKVDLDADGRVAGAHVVINTESHQIIEEFMLAANEAVARILHGAGLLFLRRVHSDPDPRKLKALDEFVAALGFRTESLQSRFALQDLLALVAGKPEQHAVNYAVLRSMQRAIYSPQEDGHYALASDCYCHFTSPIRRYPDLTIHRLLEQLPHGKKGAGNLGQLAALGEHCSDREQRAEAAERQLNKLKLLVYLHDRVGEEMDAIVTGVEEFGLFVEGVNLPAEGLVHVTSLADDYYRFDRVTHSLSGTRGNNSFRLGDRVRVTVARVDIDRRELDFRLVEHLGRPAAAGSASRRGLPHRAKGKPAAGKAAKKHRDKRHKR